MGLAERSAGLLRIASALGKGSPHLEERGQVHACARLLAQGLRTLDSPLDFVVQAPGSPVASRTLALWVLAYVVMTSAAFAITPDRLDWQIDRALPRIWCHAVVGAGALVILLCAEAWRGLWPFAAGDAGGPSSAPRADAASGSY